MKIKKLLLFALLIQTVSTNVTLKAAQGPSDATGTAILGALVAITSILYHATSSATNLAQCDELQATTEIARATEKDRQEREEDQNRQSKININNALFSGFKETNATLRSIPSNPQIKIELSKNNKTIDNFSKFLREGRNDKEIFDAQAVYQSEETLNEDTQIAPAPSDTQKTSNPGMFRKAAAFIAAAPIIAADAIANTLPINSYLANIAQSESIKGGLLATHQKTIGRIAALGLLAGTAGFLYQAYAWYTDEDRIIAQETVAELIEKQIQIAEQFKHEMQKGTLSAEEKIKLQKAYDNYMDELEQEIDEQKAIASYNVPKKLLLGAVVAAAGITGLAACVQHYFSKPADVIRANNNSENQTPINQTVNITPSEHDQQSATDNPTTEQTNTSLMPKNINTDSSLSESVEKNAPEQPEIPNRRTGKFRPSFYK